MGHHYIPQRYLRNFRIDDCPKMIWLYDKQTGRCRKAAISKVAQEPGFYDTNTEAQLNTRIEIPANAVVGKISRREAVTESERLDLSRYMAVH